MLPNNYLDKMKDLLKDEYASYEASFNEKTHRGLRVNTLKISVEEFLKIFPYKLKRIPWTSDGFYYEDDEINKHPFYYAGLYYLQEPSAMLPAEILPIEEGDIVLDACAAPGGKSTKLLTKLNNSGLLISNDISSSRQLATLKNLERFGARNIFVISEDIKKLESKYPNYFDKILVDAPCSGEGMFRKDSSLIKSWIEKGPEYYSPIQKEIITSSLHMLKDGGMLVYSTCTFDPKEDEEVIKHALSVCDCKVIPLNHFEGFVSNEYGTKLYPHKVEGEGHFVCLIQKNGIKKENMPHKDNVIVPDFLNNLNIKFENGHFKTINDKLYFVNEFNSSSLRVIRSGLYLGDLKGERFEPSQALAMSLKDNEFNKVINLDVNDERVIKYLKGETIKVNDFDLDGYVLVCVDHYPLGFSKITNGLFKNKIDKGWIYQ